MEANQRPSVAIARLRGGREYVYLLTALAASGAVGLRLKDVHRAAAKLPAPLVRAKVRWAAGSRAVTIGRASDEPQVVLDPHYYSAADDPLSFRLPYFCHPVFYASGHFQTARTLRSGDRARRIFFAGSIDHASYSRGFNFPIMRRGEVFDTIYDRFARCISADLNEKNDITIIATRDTADTVTKHKIDPDGFLAALSQSDFFICPPGWLMPHCHNMVEAMSVGAIPITNYAHYISSPLVDGVNCLTFSNEQTLVTAIERARNMSAGDIAQMRAAVLAYYDTNLEPAAVGADLRRRLSGLRRIIVNDESGR